MDDWGWLALLGVALDVIGLLIALWGVDELSRELFPNRPLPHRAVWRWVRSKLPWLRRDATVRPKTITSQARIGTPRLSADPARPSPGASEDEWFDYWDERIKKTREQIRWVSDDLTKVNAILGDRISEESKERERAVRELSEKARAWLGGDQGRGLLLTFLGLLVTLVGTVLQGVAGALG